MLPESYALAGVSLYLDDMTLPNLPSNIDCGVLACIMIFKDSCCPTTNRFSGFGVDGAMKLLGPLLIGVESTGVSP